MKNNTTVFTGQNIFLVILLAIAFFMPELAMAQNNEATQLIDFTNGFLKRAIDFGLWIAAIVAWINYFASFQPDKALQNAVLPGFLTFLAFQWADILGILLGA